MARTTLTTTALWRAVSERATEYRRSTKPFNFLTVAPAARPPANAECRRFRLVAPYECDPKRWTGLRFRNAAQAADSATHTVSCDWSLPGTAAVESYGDYLSRHQQRREHKAGPPGSSPLGSTRSLLASRTIRAEPTIHVGKKCHRPEDETLLEESTYGTGHCERVSAIVTTRSRARWVALSQALRPATQSVTFEELPKARHLCRTASRPGPREDSLRTTSWEPIRGSLVLE